MTQAVGYRTQYLCSSNHRFPKALHNDPARTTRLSTLTGHLSRTQASLDNYIWARILGEGSTEPRDYVSNVAALLEGLKSLNAKRRSRGLNPVTPIWVESPPQHFVQSFVFHDKELPSALGLRMDNASMRLSVSGTTLQNRCSSEPFTFVGCDEALSKQDSPPLWNAVIHFCNLWQNSSRGLRMTAFDALRQRASSSGTSLPATCLDAMRNWRNLLVAPLLAASDIPVVPLQQALDSRGELHPGSERVQDNGNAPDCTHFCEPSEATVHQSKALLSMAAAVLASPGAGTRRR